MMNKVILCLNVFLIVAGAQDTCPHGWKGFQDSCYLFMTGMREDWTQSATFCKGIGGKLAEVETKEENNFLRQFIQHNVTDVLTRDKTFWLGATDAFVEGTWEWVSTDPPQKISDFQDWNPGEPNDFTRHEDCLVLYHNPLQFENDNYHWNDFPCEARNCFICERPTVADPGLIG